MIVTNLSPLGITWSASIDNSPFDRQTIQRINMHFTQNQHDIAVLEVVGIPSSYLASYVNKPIKLMVRINGGKTCNFYGYVSHVEGVSSTNEGVVNGSPFQLMKITCIGSSHILRSTNIVVWNKVTLQDIVSSIAKEFRLGYSIPKDKYVFKRVVQSEESLWKLLVKVCNQLGYNISLSNSHIHIWDKEKALARQTSYTVLRGSKVKKTNYLPLPGDIIHIESTLGDVFQQQTSKSVSYIDEKGLLVTLNSNELNNELTLGTPLASRFTSNVSTSVDSFDKASRLLQSKIKQATPNTAEALVYGDPSITPGGIVKIEGYKGDFDGYWYVNSVSHELFTESLTTRLKLEKHGNYQQLPRFPIVQKYSKPPTPILIKDTWVMRSEYVNVYN